MKKTTTKLERENWLIKATDLIRADWAKLGVAVPADVKVTCGWPGGGSPRKRIGECWPRSRSVAKVNEVFISPVLDKSLDVADVLGHELLHAVDDCKSGHKAAFTKNSKAVGYSGGKHSKAVAANAVALLKSIVERLGQYPHKAVAPVEKKQSANKGLHKFVCAQDGGDTLYSTAKLIGEFGFPVCRCCGEEMVPVDREKRKLVEVR